ncbi:MAG: sigma-54-dependent Fis family transcriptional regulator [Gammaproteobacteria bacterium]|nr:MAG: sigma-54-dependent Fis family transcriptional regulator [Gammaproteobacteria bacterium]
MSLNSEKKPTLLLVDDDAIIADSLEYVLSEEYDVERASDRPSSFKLIDSMTHSPTLALVDLGLPPNTHRPDEGLAVIRKISQMHPSTRVLVLSGQDNKKHVFQAKEDGAVDFISKPCDIAEIKVRLKKQIIAGGGDASQQGDIEGIIGSSEAIELLRQQIRQIADSPYPVLIEGESGSGKEVTARNLHRCSSRKLEPFLTLNCAAFNGELLESQLFGHIKGSFTGATETKKGFFEEAGDGSLLLDEVADLPLDLQAKLLRVLEDGEYYRLGETQPRHSSARVLAATNKDIFAAIKSGQFREDLYHRLSVLTVRVPSLRERNGDTHELLLYYMQQVAEQLATFQLDDEALKLWNSYTFPGNVRELRNIIIRLSAKYPGQTIKPEVLKREMSGLQRHNGAAGGEDWLNEALHDAGFELDRLLKLVEKQAIDLALSENHGNVSKAAEMLGINRTTLYGRMDRLEDRE